jgi:AmmeMemoRadiSam system protein B/AmmeMemoRadiSam system protein A
MLSARFGGRDLKREACKLKLIAFLLIFALTACAGQPTSPATPTPTLAVATLVQPVPALPPGQIRPPVVAGSWYPDDPEELTALVDEMLAAVEPIDGEPIGLVVPHAGYVYSGPVAATGFKQLEGMPLDVAVIVASDHQPPLSNPISVWAEGGFQTPLGVVPVDVELAQALIEADSRIAFDPAAHEGEHPIEIELPFLQRVCPGCSIVPLLMGDDDEETVQALAEALVAVLSGGDKRVVVIASSDLAHYPAYEDALRVDGATLGAIETFDPTRVRETTARLMSAGYPNLATCACGEAAILVTMRVAQGLGADTVGILRYANSGDSPYGDRGQVVGYGAVMFWRYEPPELTEARREELLALARTTLETYLEDGAIHPYEPDDPALTRRCGAFVTLKERGELRGCIGHTRADLPLYQVVQQMAVSAATGDSRFPPLTSAELADVTIEISVLSPYRRVTEVAEVEVGTHGLMIFKGGQQGLLLPQVPVEQGWDREEYLDNLCLKAGLPEACWREGATLYAFTALVFGERE